MKIEAENIDIITVDTEKYIEARNKIEAMTDEEKGAQLLQCVRNISFLSGTDEAEHIVLLSDHLGITHGIHAALKCVRLSVPMPTT